MYLSLRPHARCGHVEIIQQLLIELPIQRGQARQLLFPLIAQLVGVNNKRLQLAFLVSAVRELGKFGPMKDPKTAGVDSVQEQFDAGLPAVEKSGNYAPDPSGNRTGNAPGPELVEVFERVCADAEQYVDKKRAKARQALTLEGLDDKLANLSGAVTMAYPMGLPQWDSVKVALDTSPEAGGLDGTPAQGGVLEPETASLWCAGREFARGELVSDRLGKTLPFDSFEQLRRAMFAEVPALANEGLASFEWNPPSLSDQASGGVSYPIADFYLTNAPLRPQYAVCGVLSSSEIL